MNDPAQVLREFQPGSDFFIGIDSDGCVFDSMEIKHKECFVPMFVKHNGLQAVSKYARQVWEFVNLYSKTRGSNRFPAMVRSLELLRERPEVKARNFNVPSHPAIEEWMARETKLGNATLAAEVTGGNNDLAPVKDWSDAVNSQIADIVHGDISTILLKDNAPQPKILGVRKVPPCSPALLSSSSLSSPLPASPPLFLSPLSLFSRCIRLSSSPSLLRYSSLHLELAASAARSTL